MRGPHALLPKHKWLNYQLHYAAPRIFQCYTSPTVGPDQIVRVHRLKLFDAIRTISFGIRKFLVVNPVPELYACVLFFDNFCPQPWSVYWWRRKKKIWYWDGYLQITTIRHIMTEAGFHNGRYSDRTSRVHSYNCLTIHYHCHSISVLVLLVIHQCPNGEQSRCGWDRADTCGRILGDLCLPCTCE